MPTRLIRKQFLLTEEENREIELEAKKQEMSVSNLTRKLYGLKLLTAGGKRESTGRPKKNKTNKKS